MDQSLNMQAIKFKIKILIYMYLQSIQCWHRKFSHMKHTFGGHETAMLQFISTHFCCQHYCFCLHWSQTLSSLTLETAILVSICFSVDILILFSLRFFFYDRINSILILKSIAYSGKEFNIYMASICSLISQLFFNFNI